MMGIPPSKLPPSSSTTGSRETGPSKTSKDKGKEGKDFKLPSKREKGAEEEKQEGASAKEGQVGTLFDISAGKAAAQIAEVDAAAAKAQQMAGETQASSVAKIADLITTMVDRMGAGTIGGQSYASLDLKAGPEVPDFFSGATLNLTMTDDGLNIQFTNMSTAQEQAAVKAIDQNKQQLEQMQLNLQAKGITVANLQVGSQTIALPQAEAAKPLEPPPKIGEVEPEKGKGGGDQEGGPEAGPE